MERQLDEFINQDRPSCKSIYEEYYAEREELKEKFPHIAVKSDRTEEIEAQYPWVEGAYLKLTPKDVRSLGYNPTKINDRIYKNSPQTQEKIRSILKDILVKGQFYTNKEMKEILQLIYQDRLIKGPAKANEIEKYCKAQYDRVSIGGKERVEGWWVVEFFD